MWFTENELVSAYIDFDNFLEALARCATTAKEAAESLRSFALAYDESLMKDIYERCPNKRVVYLAKYHKSYRTRKKNVNRAYRIIEKGKQK